MCPTIYQTVVQNLTVSPEMLGNAYISSFCYMRQTAFNEFVTSELALYIIKIKPKFKLRNLT
jgi:hypothetical protein